MHGIIRMALLMVLLTVFCPPGFSQLRNHSPYFHDRINTDQTYFVIHDTNAADFAWASEWTEESAMNYSEASAIFVWHFKDGAKGYAQQGEHIGDFGMVTSYLLTDKASSLIDIHRNKIQPLTRTNYPVKVELWIGEAEKKADLKLNLLIDTVCLEAQNIENNRTYNFVNCHPE
jgi:hypothetical protein